MECDVYRYEEEVHLRLALLIGYFAFLVKLAAFDAVIAGGNSLVK